MSDSPAVDHIMPDKEPVIFITSRKRWIARYLIAVCIALVSFVLYHFLGDYSFLALACAGAFIFLGIILMFFAAKPPRLQIDASGLTTMSGKSGRHQILWSQIEEIRIIRRPWLPGRPGREKLWLVAWFPSGKRSSFKVGFLPQWAPIWIKDIDGVKICDLSDFSVPATEIASAIARFAGERWNESRELPLP